MWPGDDWRLAHLSLCQPGFLRPTRRTSWLLRAMSPEQTSSDGKLFVASSCIHGIHGEGLSRKPYHFSLYIDSLSFFSEHGKGLSQIPHNTNTYISIWRWRHRNCAYLVSGPWPVTVARFRAPFVARRIWLKFRPAHPHSATNISLIKSHSHGIWEFHILMGVSWWLISPSLGGKAWCESFPPFIIWCIWFDVFSILIFWGGQDVPNNHQIWSTSRGFSSSISYFVWFLNMQLKVIHIGQIT